MSKEYEGQVAKVERLATRYDKLEQTRKLHDEYTDSLLSIRNFTVL
jgi:hypothetical protein